MCKRLRNTNATVYTAKEVHMTGIYTEDGDCISIPENALVLRSYQTDVAIYTDGYFISLPYSHSSASTTSQVNKFMQDYDIHHVFDFYAVAAVYSRAFFNRTTNGYLGINGTDIDPESVSVRQYAFGCMSTY